MPKLIFFDLDGTLAESKQPLDDEMSALLAKLLTRTDAAVISGGLLSQFLKQVVGRLPIEADFGRLHLLPTSGAALYEWHNDEWKKIYEERLSDKDAFHIQDVMQSAAEETGIIDFAQPSWGERIENRGSQVTLSALGQLAPIAEKKKWDPDHAKRRILLEKMAALLPDFLVSIGGSTSIDITKRGIDKAYGVHKLCDRLGVKEQDALYVGDELQSGGNDEAVYKTDIQTKPVKNPQDTKRIIEKLLA
ncbi:MAG: HAD-IIB family hydrolase [Minisyncoccia bacterium]